MAQSLRIGTLSKITGMSPDTIRYYEAKGLIPPAKRSEALYASNGYRLFSDMDLRRLEFIKRAKLLDLSLSQIKELMDAAQDGCCNSARPTLKALIEKKLPEIDERIAMLTSLKGNMAQLYKTLDSRADDSSECDCPSTADLIFCVFDEPAQIPQERR